MTAAQPIVPDDCHLISLDSVGSTNEKAKSLAQSGAEAGTVVWSREQTEGKGRHGRTWSSPRGNLYLSIIQRPDCRPADAPQMGFVTGVALADAIAQLSDVPVALKWPNDLMINGKKASGILLESAADAKGRLDWLVIGVGVNVESFPSDLPDVTSLREAGATITVEGLLSVFLERLFWHADEWRHTGFGPTRRRWLSFALPKGTEMRVRLPNGEVFGRFSSIDKHGSLLLDTDRGKQRIDVGDVFPLSPTHKEVR
jgi:BirA family biotin operon repressor/biotin-[acetyl-CoA-carboxylase] ligase